MKKTLPIAAAILLVAALALAYLPGARTAWALSRARAAVQAQDCPAVLDALEGIQADGLDGQFVHEVRAFCLLKAGEWRRAHDEASASLALAPESVQALAYRLAAARGLGETGEAEEDLGRLITADPTNVEWRRARAELRSGRGAWAAALEDADVALGLDPKDADMLNIRAHAWHGLGNWEKAYADVVALLEVRPATASYRDAADLAIPLDKLDEADAHLAAALAREPDDAELHILACRLRMAHTEEPDAGSAQAGAALRECERAAKLAPRDGPTRRRLGRMLMEQGELDGALAHADEAARLMPGSCLTHRLRAELLLKLKKPAEALAAAEAALAALPEDSEVNTRSAEGLLRQSLADVLLALKREDEARSELEKALTLLDPDDEDGAAAVKQKLRALSGPKR